MEKNNELVVYGENNEIVSCNFQRVDLTNPPTVLNYCSDVIDTIGNVLDSTAQLEVENEIEIIDSKKIDQITSFR